MIGKHRFVSWGLGFASATAFVIAVSAQPGLAPGWEPQQQQQQQQQDPEPGGRQGGRAGGAPRPYAQVITAQAKTDEGIFKVHRITTPAADTLYYEIPKAELGKDFIWNTSIKKTTIGAGFGGQNVGSRVVRWTKRGDRILLLNMDFSDLRRSVAAGGAGGRRRELSGDHPDVAGGGLFAVAAIRSSTSPRCSSRSRTCRSSRRAARSAAAAWTSTAAFLERAISFPENINVEVTMTLHGRRRWRGGGGRRTRGRRRARHARLERHRDRRITAW